MDFVEILKRVNRDLYDSSDKAALPKLARFLERSKGIGGLLKTNNAVLDAFPISSILKLQDVYEQHQAWKDAFRNTKRVLATSKLTLPDRSLTKTAFPHELSALERVAKMCQRAGYADLASWENAVDAHLALWNACVSLAMDQTMISSVISASDHADVSHFESYAFSRQNVKELKKYLWLGARRGEKAGVLKIELELPSSHFQTQAKAYIGQMGLAAQSRDIAAVLEELVENNIDAVVRSLIDNEAEREALQTARDAYVGVLSVPKPDAEKIVSVYVGSADSARGLVVVDNAGKMLETREVPVSQSITDAVTEVLTSSEATAAVLPVSAGDDTALREVGDLLDGREELTVVRILPAALAIARQKLAAPAPIASALILAFRAIRPTVEWANVPASAVGLGEFSADLDEAKLEAALTDSRLLLAYEAKRNVSGGGPGKRVQKKRPLNPLVRTIRDLKPGMTLDGIVTNLTKFGAFVNVGLATEAMIHVSQLSTDFIEEPSQVVKVGQTVNARVLEVIPEKGRIALSLKPAGADIPKRQQESKELQQARANASAIFNDDELDKLKEAALQGPPAGRGASSPYSGMSRQGGGPPMSSGGGGDVPKKSRNEALADLNALFKK
ncbi:MAG: S1 RNA-binding domain-containing protein [Deltaproteobacteria bacterium]|nr:S1 RNA-binding domain-containing protein [Deltaproteobacteria bacterium]MBN2673577.1 S1 RNA-binding domain-containing protein [Deltaproteobacteria bacterium]